MGRHAVDKPALRRRMLATIDSYLASKNVPVPRLPKISRKTNHATWGAFFAVMLALVSVIDPYSGTVVSADTMSVYDPNSKDPEQTYGNSQSQQISFARGGFNIVTGDDATAIFVETADLPTPGSAKEYALKYLLELDYGSDQYSCLVKLWTRESQWRVDARNKSSGAYGIPQSLPGTKMASEGPDWLTNPETQIRWGVKYIKGRYGAPCGALAHSDKYGWY